MDVLWVNFILQICEIRSHGSCQCDLCWALDAHGYGFVWIWLYVLVTWSSYLIICVYPLVWWFFSFTLWSCAMRKCLCWMGSHILVTWRNTLNLDYKMECLCWLHVSLGYMKVKHWKLSLYVWEIKKLISYTFHSRKP